MSFSSDVREELLTLRMWDNNSNLKQDEQIARLVLREAFIKSGFINDPSKDYHLEILEKSSKKAEDLKTILTSFGIKANVTKKGKGSIVYIKDGEEISEFLALIGANNAVLRYEEERVIKDTRNNINRMVNCETANLNKTIDAAVEQIENIKLLKRKKIFDTLPDNLKEIADVRIKYPDLSYEELGNKLTKKLGKSGVSHRLRKINEIANSIRGE